MEHQLEETSVVVVGGGLVGLSAAIFLAWHKVSCVLLEKYAGPSLHPRAVGYTPRTMEIFSSVGISDQIPQVPQGFRLRRIRVESLTGEWEKDTMPWNTSNKDSGAGRSAEVAEDSPFNGAALAQDRLEPIVLEKAKHLGVDVRMGVRMTGFKQDNSGVEVAALAESGKQYYIRASFMIAADGHRSQVRETLSIGTSGRGYLNTVGSVLFHALLDDYSKDHHQFVIRQPGLEAFLTTYGDNRWVLMFTDNMQRTEDEQKQAIRNAVGKQGLEFNIITTGQWELKAVIADTFQVGRVFLAGDAAHTLPPTRGGYGANTGIQDAFNIAWKLAAVVNGISSTQLLDTYTMERWPVAWLRHQQTFARQDYAQYRQPSDEETEIYDDSAIEFGQIYTSSCIIDDEHSEVEPLARPPDQWNGRPGTRAPHSWLKNPQGQRVSSLDLFGKYWTLVTEDERWLAVVESINGRLPFNIRCEIVEGERQPPEDESFCKILGLSAGGASLIRPDGHVAWRSRQWPTDSEMDLSPAVLSQVACVSPPNKA